MKKSWCALGLLLATCLACSFDTGGLPGPTGPVCGNGAVEEGETCDDGGTFAGDGCSVTCTVEPGWTCAGEEPSVCSAVCGDGRIVGTEGCDDQGTVSGDGCDGTCAVEPGWHCEDAPSACWTVCGDGRAAGDEGCDDGNLTPGDGCDVDCTVEPGWTCVGEAPSACAAICGDGLVVGDEVCDGTNLAGRTCQTEGFYDGTISCMAGCGHLDLANCGRFCGDGIIDLEFGEVCDGEDPGTATCAGLGFPGGALACDEACQADTSGCHTWLQVVAGSDHACAVRSDHTLWCWGANGDGQLGRGTIGTSASTMQQVVALGTGVAMAAPGEYHTCALRTDGTAWCWGRNFNGQLGNDTATSSLTPVQVKLDADRTLGDVAWISAGEAQSCAVTTSGAVFCWGANWNGRLGDGTYTDRRVATPVSGLGSGWARVLTVRGHTCARSAAGALSCWGRNWSGQLGDDSNTERTSPVAVVWPVSPGPVVTDFAVGEEFTCAVTAAGAAFCFGENFNGQLGDDTTTDRRTPVPVNGQDAQVSAVAAGAQHACLIRDGGGLFCWGSNFYGRLGDGTNTERHDPVGVTGLTDGVAAVTAGRRSTCALRSGRLSCWGYNWYGQLGDGTTTDRYTPVGVVYPVE